MTTADHAVRVLHIANHFDVKLGGSIWAAFQIAASAHGGTVVCELAGTINRGSDTAAYFAERFPQLRLHLFNCHFPRHNHASIGLQRWMSRNAGNYDVIHCHQIFHWPFIYAGLAASKWRKPLVVSPHNSLDPADLKKHSWLKDRLYGPLVIRPVLSRARVLLCTAALEAERAVTYRASPEPPREVIPLPVANPLEELAGGSFRKQFVIPPDAFVLLFLSRLDRKKGLDQLIPAFACLAKTNRDLVLAIAGAGDEAVKRDGQVQAQHLGVASQIRWCGFMAGADKAAAYRESDLFVLPSYYENFALVVIEAMHAGLPVLTTTGVFIWKTLANQQAAVVCEPTAEALCLNLQRLIADPALRSRLAKTGKEVAEREFSPGAVRQGYQDLYHRLAGAAAT